MPNLESLLIEAGIAGVFAVFAIMLFREGAKILRSTNQMFIEFLKAEREQRMEIMTKAQENMVELTKAVQQLTHPNKVATLAGSREKTKPRGH